MGRFSIGQTVIILPAQIRLEGSRPNPYWASHVGERVVVHLIGPEVIGLLVFDYAVTFSDGEQYWCQECELESYYDGDEKSSWDVGVWRPRNIKRPVSA